MYQRAFTGIEGQLSAKSISLTLNSINKERITEIKDGFTDFSF